MTKRSAVLFVLIFTFLIASALSSCGTPPSSDSSTSQSSESAPGESSADEQAGSSEQPSESSDPSGSSAQNGTSIPDTDESAASDWGVADTADNSETEENDSTASFNEVLVDRDDLFFAIKEIRADAALGYSWKVYIENRTDQNLMFSLEKAALNGVMCDPLWAEVIAAGKKGNCEIIWMRDALEARQIGEVVQADFTLNVYDDDDYTAPPLMHDPFTVYPLGKEQKVSAAGARKPAETDQVLVDNEDCSVVVTGYDPGNSWGYGVQVYLYNKTDEDLIFSAENTSVNGIMCEPFWAEIVSADHSAISTILWDQAALDENAITEVKEISLPLRVYSDYNVAAPYVEETFELRP